MPADVGGDFTSNNSLHLAQMRATYRLGYSWDVSAEARWFGGLGDYSELGYALEAGYYATPDLRIYGGYSGGGAYDDDFGVNRSASGFYLGVSAKINSLFDGFGLQDVAPSQQRESASETENTTNVYIPGVTNSSPEEKLPTEVPDVVEEPADEEPTDMPETADVQETVQPDASFDGQTL